MDASLIPTPASTAPAYSLNLPWVESPFFPELLREKQLSTELADLARHYHEHGYVILKNLVSSEFADRVVRESTPLFRPEVTDGDRSRYRAMDGWRESPAIAELASLPRVLELLETLYGRKPIPFQTLNFKYGTQQCAHSDTIHFSSVPARFMCGVWVALEDVTIENGPLFYYPGSQRLPELDSDDIGLSAETANYPHYERVIASMMKALGLQPQVLTIPKGDALIWSSNLVHGGSRIRNPALTRFSQVTHYYFENCLYHQPIVSARHFGEYMHKADLKDIRTQQPISQNYNGRAVRPVVQRNGRTKFEIESGRPDAAAEASQNETASPYGATLRTVAAVVKQLPGGQQTVRIAKNLLSRVGGLTER